MRAAGVPCDAAAMHTKMSTFFFLVCLQFVASHGVACGEERLGMRTAHTYILQRVSE